MNDDGGSIIWPLPLSGFTGERDILGDISECGLLDFTVYLTPDRGPSVKAVQLRKGNGFTFSLSLN